MSMTAPILEVSGLKVEIPVRDAVLRPVRGIDINVAKGETVAIVGESGCGKSLTALAIMGLLPRQAKLTSDRIDLNGESLSDASPRRWRKLRGDRIVVMYGGEVVEAGTCDEVLARPLHPYTEGLMRSIPVPGETRRGETLGFIPGVVPRQTGDLTRCGFLERCPYAHAPCAEGPIALRDAGDGHLMRCVLPADGSGRDPEAWTRQSEASS